MPSYTYRCEVCGHTEDFILKVDNRNDKEGTQCPACHDGKLSKQVTAAAFGEGYKLGLTGKNNELRDRLKEIHKNTPGSRLDQVSTINKI